MSVATLTSSTERIEDELDYSIFDLLNFRISSANSQDSGYQDNHVDRCIPSESVYYSTEYLRLQTEIDYWKGQAKEFELENVRLRLKAVEQQEKEIKLTQENVEVYTKLKIKIDQVRTKKSKFWKALKESRTQIKKTKQLCKKLRLVIKNAKKEIIELKSDKTVCAKSSCDNNITLQFNSKIIKDGDGCGNTSEKSCLGNNIHTFQSTETTFLGNNSQSFDASFQSNCDLNMGNQDTDFNLSNQGNYCVEINDMTNSSQGIVHDQDRYNASANNATQIYAATSPCSFVSENAYTYQINSSANPTVPLHFEINDLFQEN